MEFSIFAAHLVRVSCLSPSGSVTKSIRGRVQILLTDKVGVNIEVGNSVGTSFVSGFEKADTPGSSLTYIFKSRCLPQKIHVGPLSLLLFVGPGPGK